MKVAFIINPTSGTLDHNSLKKRILSMPLLQEEGAWEVVYTEKPYHGITLSKEYAKKGFDTVVAVGGDGTVNEVGSGLHKTDTALGIIPKGSGNGLANHLLIPKDLDQAIEVIKKRNLLKMDVIDINGDLALNIAGIGFEAETARLFNQSKSRGLWTYAKCVISLLFSYRARSYELLIDNQNTTESIYSMAFANGSQYGNNILVSKEAKIDNGVLDFVKVLPFPLRRAPLFLLHYIRHIFTSKKYMHIFKGKEILIKERGLFINIDGDAKQYSDFVRIKIIPKSLNIISNLKKA